MGYSEGTVVIVILNLTYTSSLRTASLVNLVLSFFVKNKFSIHCNAVDNAGTDGKFFFLDICVLHAFYVHFNCKQTVS